MSTVTRRARAIASRAYARRKKFQKSMTHPYSRSHDNLIELQEDEEDELMRKDKLKFPSDYTIDSAYYQMLGNKEEALRTLRGLIRASREVEKGGVARQEKDGELEGSLSEPDLYQGTQPQWHVHQWDSNLATLAHSKLNTCFSGGGGGGGGGGSPIFEKYFPYKENVFL